MLYAYIQKNAPVPYTREMRNRLSALLGVSASTISQYFHELIAAGQITWDVASGGIVPVKQEGSP